MDPVERKLLLEICRRPRDDEPRQVYADWLGDRGDPRGELIMLQQARPRGAEPTRRELALLDEHSRAWLGPFADAMAASSTEQLARRFDRGFLAQPLVLGELHAASGQPAAPPREHLEGRPGALLLRLSPRFYVIEDTPGSATWGTHVRVRQGRAHDPEGAKGLVALKADLGSREDRARSEAQLRHERDVLRSWRDPRLQRLVGLARARGQLVLVSEWVQGCTLRELYITLRARRQQLDEDELAALGAELFAGLHALHQAMVARGDEPRWGVPEIGAHCQIKLEGGVVLLDGAHVGALREQLFAAEFRRERLTHGALRRIAPEVVQGTSPGPKSEVFSAAMTLWGTALGADVFHAESDMEILDGVLAFSGEDPRLSAYGAAGAVLRRALRPLPEERADADELSRAFGDLAPSTWPPRLSELVARTLKRRALG